MSSVLRDDFDGQETGKMVIKSLAHRIKNIFKKTMLGKIIMKEVLISISSEVSE